jgi:AcrR family transcriptional regulator
MHDTSTANVRDRILAAADELFYREGVQTVGVDRISKRAGASKKSLYAVFGSKEALVVAYLEVRRISIEESITHGLARFGTPRDRLLGIFEIQGDIFASPDYNGCPFLAASAEAAPGSLVERAHADYRAWVRALGRNWPPRRTYRITRQSEANCTCCTTPQAWQRMRTATPRRRQSPVTLPPPSWISQAHQGAEMIRQPPARSIGSARPVGRTRRRRPIVER